MRHTDLLSGNGGEIIAVEDVGEEGGRRGVRDRACGNKAGEVACQLRGFHDRSDRVAVCIDTERAVRGLDTAGKSGSSSSRVRDEVVG